jgi:AcrR family transcriptional regulator
VPVESVTPLRARKKAATRQALHEAALRLALAAGLDGVTVEDIADEVGVSRRTFSNYFANKEDAVLHGDRERTRRLLALVQGRPAGERPWTALRRAAAELYAEIGLPDPDRVAQMRLLRRHPSLAARQVADQIALEHDLADVLAHRCGDAELSRLMAATFLAGVRTAAALWLERGGAEPLTEVIEHLLDRLRLR